MDLYRLKTILIEGEGTEPSSATSPEKTGYMSWVK